MDVIALVPAFVALVVCVAYSPSRAFLAVYLPVLLLLPSTARWQPAGLPDVGFAHAAILPIAIAVMLASVSRWRVSLADVLVVLLVGLMAVSEVHAGGLVAAQDSLVSWTCSILMPYFVARWLIEPAGLRIPVAKTIVGALAMVAVVSMWEFRMGTNPVFIDLWARFFDGQLDYSNQYRFGFARIKGPFRHSILTGMAFGVGILLQIGLHRARAWRSQLMSLALLGMLVLGSLMTLSRGPWIALAAGLCLLWIGALRHRPRLMIGSLLGCALAGVLLLTLIDQYASTGMASSESDLQQTVAYRRELMDIYMPQVWARPWLGWGDLGWTATQHMESVDNQFLLTSLNHGMLTTGVFIALVAWIAMRLVRFTVLRPESSPDGRSACILLACLLCLMLAITTAWMGGQLQPLMYMLLGWSEGLLRTAAAPSANRARPPVRRQTQDVTRGFQRLLTPG